MNYLALGLILSFPLRWLLHAFDWRGGRVPENMIREDLLGILPFLARRFSVCNECFRHSIMPLSILAGVLKLLPFYLIGSGATIYFTRIHFGWSGTKLDRVT